MEGKLDLKSCLNIYSAGLYFEDFFFITVGGSNQTWNLPLVLIIQVTVILWYVPSELERKSPFFNQATYAHYSICSCYACSVDWFVVPWFNATAAGKQHTHRFTQTRKLTIHDLFGVTTAQKLDKLKGHRGPRGSLWGNQADRLTIQPH